MSKLKILRGPLRLRDDHNTAGNVILSLGTNDIVTIDPAKTFTAVEELWKNGAAYQQIGDRWAYVTAGTDGKPITGWTAITHLGAGYSRVVEDDNTGSPTVTIVKATVHYKRGDGDDVYTQDLFPQ